MEHLPAGCSSTQQQLTTILSFKMYKMLPDLGKKVAL
jgi:hypothetical protein